MKKRRPYTSQESAPLLSKENPFESMMQRFGIVAHVLKVWPGAYEYLKRPDRQVIVSIDAVYETAERYMVTLRIGTYILAIDKVARTFKLRGIYA